MRDIHSQGQRELVNDRAKGRCHILGLSLSGVPQRALLQLFTSKQVGERQSLERGT